MDHFTDSLGQRQLAAHQTTEYKVVWVLPPTPQAIQGYFNQLASRGWRYHSYIPWKNTPVLIFIRERGFYVQ